MQIGNHLTELPQPQDELSLRKTSPAPERLIQIRAVDVVLHQIEALSHPEAVINLRKKGVVQVFQHIHLMAQILVIGGVDGELLEHHILFQALMPGEIDGACAALPDSSDDSVSHKPSPICAFPDAVRPVRRSSQASFRESVPPYG